MQQTAWLAQRVVLAIILMTGFYVLTLAVVAVLLWIPYAEYAYLERVDLRILIGCLVSAIALLLALLPRRDRFEPPGPELDERTEPRLFAFVREIADATQQQMPTEIYVLNEVNAWVAQRGGTLGFGSRRVMGIGLPLLHALPLPEVKSVIAHEFGHYAASDVALGPWIYGTRAAIARAMTEFDSSFIGLPFRWYGRMFLRLTMAISRRQEFVADQVSARIVGADVAARTLRRVNAMAAAYAVYSQRDVLPVLRAGFVPPISEGFQTFLDSDLYRQVSARADDVETEPGSADTHPPLRARLAALGAADMTTAMPEHDRPPSLLSHADSYTLPLLAKGLSDDVASALKPITWRGVGDRVYATQWRDFVRTHLEWLAPLTLDTLPRGRDAMLTFTTPFKILGGIENERRVGFASALLGATLATHLIDLGWQLETLPGRRPTLQNGERRCEPFTLIEAVTSGKMNDAAWTDQCRELGISGVLLSPSLAVH